VAEKGKGPRLLLRTQIAEKVRINSTGDGWHIFNAEKKKAYAGVRHKEFKLNTKKKRKDKTADTALRGQRLQNPKWARFRELNQVRGAEEWLQVNTTIVSTFIRGKN